MQNVVLDKDGRKAVYEFSIGTRLTHWLRAASIVVLVGTGFYLSYVFQAPSANTGQPVNFMQAKYRFVHEVAGFLLMACIIFKSYLFFTDRVSRNELASFKNLVDFKLWIDIIKFYLFIGKHPKIRGVYNPLQLSSYIMFYLVIAGIILTGLILYVHVYHEGIGGLLYPILRPIEAMFGGLSSVRVWHRILMWVVIIFVCVHVYMAFFNAIKGKDGTLDAIVSGYKYERE